jgi:hypothetical protein
MKKTFLLFSFVAIVTIAQAQIFNNMLYGYLIEQNNISNANTPIAINYSCGISFNDTIYPSPNGMYQYNLPYPQGCFTLSFTNCSGDVITSDLLTYSPSDSTLFFSMVYCDSASGGGGGNPPYQLCVYANATDSSIFIFQDNTVEYFLIKAYSTSNGDSLALVDSYVSNNNSNGGSYACFTINDNDTYYVKAALTPSSTSYPTLLPTYYQESLLWSNATAITLNQNQYISIMMQEGINPGGPGFIGGYVSQGANRTEEADAAGDPLANVQMILTKLDGTPVAHTLTNASGQYIFNNLLNGTYKVWADILNRVCTPAVVTLFENMTFDNVNFSVNNQTVAGGISGVNNSSNTLNKLLLMGNPVASTAELLAIGNLSEQNIKIILSDIQGKVLRAYTAQAANQHTLVLSDLPNGIYFIQAKAETGTFNFKVVKQ